MKKILKNWRYSALAACAAVSGVLLVTDSDMILIAINTKMLFLVTLFSFFYLLARWDREGSIPELSAFMKDE